jgi:hypothetical protein
MPSFDGRTDNRVLRAGYESSVATCLSTARVRVRVCMTLLQRLGIGQRGESPLTDTSRWGVWTCASPPSISYVVPAGNKGDMARSTALTSAREGRTPTTPIMNSRADNRASTSRPTMASRDRTSGIAAAHWPDATVGRAAARDRTEVALRMSRGGAFSSVCCWWWAAAAGMTRLR